jgi:hypothetical protein
MDNRGLMHMMQNWMLSQLAAADWLIRQSAEPHIDVRDIYCGDVSYFLTTESDENQVASSTNTITLCGQYSVTFVYDLLQQSPLPPYMWWQGRISTNTTPFMKLEIRKGLILCLHHSLERRIYRNSYGDGDCDATCYAVVTSKSVLRQRCELGNRLC